MNEWVRAVDEDTLIQSSNCQPRLTQPLASVQETRILTSDLRCRPRPPSGQCPEDKQTTWPMI